MVLPPHALILHFTVQAEAHLHHYDAREAVSDRPYMPTKHKTN